MEGAGIATPSSGAAKRLLAVGHPTATYGAILWTISSGSLESPVAPFYWSTSMAQKLNDSLPPSQKEPGYPYGFIFPRVLQPWPLLCVPNDNGELETLCLGGDEGCERGHDASLRGRKVGDYLEAGPMRMPDFTPRTKAAYHFGSPHESQTDSYEQHEPRNHKELPAFSHS